jgi:hypothetical protein
MTLRQAIKPPTPLTRSKHAPLFHEVIEGAGDALGPLRQSSHRRGDFFARGLGGGGRGFVLKD